jgi:hypothetical protein
VLFPFLFCFFSALKMRIPTKSATYSNMYPATDSDFIPATLGGVPAGQRG